MKLEAFGTRLDDYLNGDLDAEKSRQIEVLLTSAPEARRELEAYRRMIASLGELPDSIEPKRDLFPKIEARIDEPARDHGKKRRWAVLAAVLAAAIGLAYLFLPWRGAQTPPTTALREVTPQTVPAASRTIGNTPTSRAERDLLAATEQLRSTLDEHRAALPPETLRLVERNLEIIQGAITEIQQAIDRDPGNQDLNRALVAYYQHELALLEQVSRAASRL